MKLTLTIAIVIATCFASFASLLVSKDRQNWRFCHKCYVMFYNGDEKKGTCAAGGAHEGQGYNFVLPYGVPETPTAQTNWRQCRFCKAMFFDGFQQKGHCPTNKIHEADTSFRYVLPHDVPGKPTTQTLWRYCGKCHAMFFNGYDQKGNCAAGGAHEAIGYNFVLPHDRSAPLEPPRSTTQPIRHLGKVTPQPNPPILVLGKPMVPPAQAGSEWLTSAEYQREFDTKKSGSYPANIEGRCDNGREQFRVVWKNRPSKSAFESYHRMTQQEFEDRKNALRKQGYSLEFSDVFQDCNDVTRFQATWLKKN